MQSTVTLAAALEASQAAIQCVSSSMHIVRAALSAADIQLADRAMDVATVAMQQAADRLQAATGFAAQELLLSQQQRQRMLRQMHCTQRSEAELEDTCCSIYRC
jgi:Xaa-Pro aminopeptidase